MTQNKTALMLTCLLATALIWNLVPTGMNAGAQPPKGRVKWEYATLSHSASTLPYSDIVTWIAGAKVFKADWKTKDQTNHPFSLLNKELGGDEVDSQATVIGVLLDRIGQDGWELVSHAQTTAPSGIKAQTWTFKRSG